MFFTWVRYSANHTFEQENYTEGSNIIYYKIDHYYLLFMVYRRIFNIINGNTSCRSKHEGRGTIVLPQNCFQFFNLLFFNHLNFEIC